MDEEKEEREVIDLNALLNYTVKIMKNPNEMRKYMDLLQKTNLTMRKKLEELEKAKNKYIEEKKKDQGRSATESHKDEPPSL